MPCNVVLCGQTNTEFRPKVLGEPGGDLNYEETVVYNNAAIRPAYLIVYSSKPPKQPQAHHGSLPTIGRLIASLFETPLAT